MATAGMAGTGERAVKEEEFRQDGNEWGDAARPDPLQEMAGNGKGGWIPALRQDRGMATDLAVSGAWLAATVAAIVIPSLNTTPLRLVLAFPALLFIPGYCLVAALFPRVDDISLVERIMLSCGFSIAVVPLIGLGLNFTPWGITLDPLLASLSLFCAAMIAVALARRLQVRPRQRFRLVLRAAGGEIRRAGSAIRKESPVDRSLSIVLAILIIAATAAATYAVVAPKEGERFTEFFLLGKDRLAGNYPDHLNISEVYPLYIGVGNQEERGVRYTIETWLLRTEFDNVTNVTRISAMDSNNYLSFFLGDNETTVIPYNLSIRRSGYNRVEFLLFNETVPGLGVVGLDRINASYRNLHLWVTTGPA